MDGYGSVPSAEETLAHEPADARPRPATRTKVGRFALLDRIGAGSMGVVFAAYDEVLDRKVAVKLIAAPLGVGAARHTQLLREAKTMAKLRHDNVVQVYEAGLEGDDLYIAMEFVAGRTLRVDESDHEPEAGEWRQILSMYRQAGQGLAAAHRAGIVHRDFKPDNAMIGDDGVVRVMDFGLALDRERDADQAATLEASTPTAGTPAYMAPEQWAGLAVDARSDQFAFCVALHEALFGERPYRGESLPDLGSNVLKGHRVQARSRQGVPDKVRRAVLRGLSTDPQSRWPSMDALLTELDVDRPPSRRFAWMLGALGVGVGLAVAMSADGPAADPCDGVARTVEEVWSPERRDELVAAMQSTQSAFAAHLAERVPTLIDSYARELAAARQQACADTMVARTQSEAVMLQRMSCLDDRERALRAQLDLLASADAAAVEHAVDAVEGLPRLTACDDLAYVSADVPPPDERDRDEVERLREVLASVTALDHGGQSSRARALGQGVLREAEALGYQPLVAEALTELADIERGQGDNGAALEHVHRAYAMVDLASPLTAVEVYRVRAGALVRRGEHDAALADLRRALTLYGAVRTTPDALSATLYNDLSLVLSRMGRYEEALTEVGRGLAILEAKEQRDVLTLALAYNNAGTFNLYLSNYEQGLAQLQLALEMRTEALGPNHPRVGITLSNIGSALQDLDRNDESIGYYRRAVEVLTGVYGASNVQTARVRDNLGTALREAGRLDEALDQHRQAKASYDAKPGVDRLYVIQNHNFTGVSLRRAGRLDDALVEYRKALGLARELLAPDNPELATFLDNIGVVLRMQGEPDLALAEHRAALALREPALEASHPTLATSHQLIGQALHAKGDFAGARAELEVAYDLGREAHGLRHTRTASIAKTLAQTLLALDDGAGALAYAEPAFELLGKVHNGMPSHASAAFTLARALRETGDRSARPRRLAQQAADILAKTEPDGAELVALREWLADEAPSP